MPESTERPAVALVAVFKKSRREAFSTMDEFMGWN
jgi:hypothetical protein